MDINQQILKFIGAAVVYGGGSAAIAYAIFLFLGKKWIENKFAERLEKYRHEQNKELEEVRYRINALFNRITKIHEKEIEVLPEAWSRLHQVLSLLSQLTSPLQKYPDLNRMTDPQLKEFLNQSRLHDFEKEEIIKVSDKVKYYTDQIFWHDLYDVKMAFSNFHNYIEINRVFLSNDLKEQFTKIDDVMWNSLLEREIGHGAGDGKMWREANKRIRDEVVPLRDKIEELVQERLQYHKAK